MIGELLPLVVATRNAGKAAEFARLLGPGVEVHPLAPNIELPEESGSTFAENAELKAEAVFAAQDGRIAVLADDSGLEVTALAGLPGVRSARFAGEQASDSDNVRRLLAELGSASERSARFVCHLYLRLPESRASSGRRSLQSFGFLEGRITREPRGGKGFGYDPVFLPDGWNRTLAEVSGEEKDRVSHRGAAVRGLRRLLEEEGLVPAPGPPGQAGPGAPGENRNPDG